MDVGWGWAVLSWNKASLAVIRYTAAKWNELNANDEDGSV